MSKKIIVFSIIFSLLFSSCATKELWSKQNYKESVESFLISEDGKQLVVIGKRYHYIFELDSKLKDILESDKRKHLKVFFQDFQLTSNEDIGGKYIMYYNINREDLNTDETYRWFVSKGFEESKDNSILNNDLKYMLIGELKGKRYNLNGVVIPSSQKFNHPYCVRINENYYKYEQDVRLKNTPITVTVDGVVTIALSALVVLILSSGTPPAGGGGGNSNYSKKDDVNNYNDLRNINAVLNCSVQDKAPDTFFLVFE